MSAENFIEINLVKKKIIVADFEGNEYARESFETLSEAFIKAQELQDEWEPEYGITITGAKEDL